MEDILHNFNLLDEFFITDDSSTSTGEIQIAPIDSDIAFSPADKEMKRQRNLALSAVEKIWQGYLTAKDQGAYTKQFDIYPMRDFDEYMASLGAVRVNNEQGDFGPASSEKKIDWVEIAKKEMESRYAEYQENANKIKEQTRTQQLKDDRDFKLNEKDVKINYALIDEGLKKKGIDLGSNEKERNQKILDIFSTIRNDGQLKDVKGIENLSQVQLATLKAYMLSDGVKIYSTDKSVQEARNKSIEAKNTLSPQEKEDALKKKKENEERLKEIDNQTDSGVSNKVKEKLKRENIDLDKQLNNADNKWKEFVKGKDIDEEKQKQIFDGLETNSFKKTIKDGFTTQGPFCLEKRDYFIKFRNSISHWKTEDREAVPTKVKISNRNDNIEQIKHTNVVLERKESDPAPSPSNLTTAELESIKKAHTRYNGVKFITTNKELREKSASIEKSKIEIYNQSIPKKIEVALMLITEKQVYSRLYQDWDSFNGSQNQKNAKSFLKDYTPVKARENIPGFTFTVDNFSAIFIQNFPEYTQTKDLIYYRDKYTEFSNQLESISQAIDPN